MDHYKPDPVRTLASVGRQMGVWLKSSMGLKSTIIHYASLLFTPLTCRPLSFAGGAPASPPLV